MLKKLFAFHLLLISCCIALTAQTPVVVKEPEKTNQAEIRRQSFEKVWRTVNEKHYDPTFGGVDWKRMREIYEPKALAAKTDAEFHRVLNQMLGELKLSHYNVIPRLSNTELEAMQTGSGIIGVELKIIDGQAVVWRVEANSTAEQAGLKTGFVVEKIDGKTVAELLAPMEKRLAERKENERVARMFREKTLDAFLGGKPETIARIEVLDGANKPQTFEIKRYAARTQMSEAFGNFPPQPVIFESKMLDGNVGYIRFNMWIMPQMLKIREAIRSMKTADGIIFDLRGNPGGLGGMATGVAGLLVTEQISLGSMKSRESENKFIVYPQSAPFAGRVVVLIDYGSASTSELFAAGLQEAGRAVVVGETSAGGILPSIFDTLPTGAIFQYAISDYRSPKNVFIENRGVIPDKEVKSNRQALLDGRDAQIEESVRQIKNK